MVDQPSDPGDLTALMTDSEIMTGNIESILEEMVKPDYCRLPFVKVRFLDQRLYRLERSEISTSDENKCGLKVCPVVKNEVIHPTDIVTNARTFYDHPI